VPKGDITLHSITVGTGGRTGYFDVQRELAG
jgi:hypothetical protein